MCHVYSVWTKIENSDNGVYNKLHLQPDKIPSLFTTTPIDWTFLSFIKIFTDRYVTKFR